MRLTRVGEIQDRFWQRVDKSGPNGCWIWGGTKIKDGYGVISGILFGERHVEKGQKMLAHRVSWMIVNGDIPKSDEYHGWVVMHKCDNPSCVNPDHLTLGTQKANVHDMIAKKRDVRVSIIGAKHKRAKLTDEQVAEIRSSAIGTVELARQYDVDRSTVRRSRYGKSYAEGEEAATLQVGPRVRTGRKGEDNPAAKLTDDLVREIRASDLSAAKWAERLGMHPDVIRSARIGKRFAHIPMVPNNCPDHVELAWLRRKIESNDSASVNPMTLALTDVWIASGALAVDEQSKVARDDVARLMKIKRITIPRYLRTK